MESQECVWNIGAQRGNELSDIADFFFVDIAGDEQTTGNNKWRCRSLVSVFSRYSEVFQGSLVRSSTERDVDIFIPRL